MKRIKGADVRNGDTIRREYAEPISSLRAVEFVAKGACPGNGDALFLLDSPVKMLWPAGTTLWLTRFHYPWAKGDRIVLTEDWFDGTPVAEVAAVYTMKVPLDAVTDTPPEPAVELPSEPTLGWATFFGDPALASFSVDEHGELRSRVTFNNRFEGAGSAYTFATKVTNITAFTPATAVPTDALDALRAEHGDDQPGACIEVIDFLAAVDAANRTDR